MSETLKNSVNQSSSEQENAKDQAKSETATNSVSEVSRTKKKPKNEEPENPEQGLATEIIEEVFSVNKDCEYLYFALPGGQAFFTEEAALDYVNNSAELEVKVIYNPFLNNVS